MTFDGVTAAASAHLPSDRRELRASAGGQNMDPGWPRAVARARARMWRGLLSAAGDACDAVLAARPQPGAESERLECLGYLALISAWRGQHRRSVALAHETITTAYQEGHPSSFGARTADVALAWVYLETYDLRRSEAHVAAALSEQGGLPGVADAAQALVRARLHKIHGRPCAARAVLRNLRNGQPELAGWLEREVVAEEGLISAMAEGSELHSGPGPSGPVVTITPAGPMFDPMLAQSLPARVRRLLATAADHAARGQERDAVAALTHALRLAAPERLRRPFREAAPEVRRLLIAEGLSDRHPWLAPPGRPGPAREIGPPADALLTGKSVGSPRPGPPRRPAPVRQPAPSPVPGRRRRPVPVGLTAPPASSLIEPLTTREQEVLVHLDELLTTEEIARTMSVSVNTIKTHVRSILRKLASSRRNEAVRRAHELGLLLPI